MPGVSPHIRDHSSVNESYSLNPRASSSLFADSLLEISTGAWSGSAGAHVELTIISDQRAFRTLIIQPLSNDPEHDRPLVYFDSGSATVYSRSKPSSHITAKTVGNLRHHCVTGRSTNSTIRCWQRSTLRHLTNRARTGGGCSDCRWCAAPSLSPGGHHGSSRVLVLMRHPNRQQTGHDMSCLLPLEFPAWIDSGFRPAGSDSSGFRKNKP